MEKSETTSDWTKTYPQVKGREGMLGGTSTVYLPQRFTGQEVFQTKDASPKTKKAYFSGLHDPCTVAG